MLIYRMEHADTNEGPFRYSLTIALAIYSIGDLPEPSRDGCKFSSGMVCGCNSMELLFTWFGKLKTLEAFKANNMVVRVFEVTKNFSHGKHQTVFVREDATIVETMDVMEFRRRYLTEEREKFAA